MKSIETLDKNSLICKETEEFINVFDIHIANLEALTKELIKDEVSSKKLDIDKLILDTLTLEKYALLTFASILFTVNHKCSVLEQAGDTLVKHKNISGTKYKQYVGLMTEILPMLKIATMFLNLLYAWKMGNSKTFKNLLVDYYNDKPCHTSKDGKNVLSTSKEQPKYGEGFSLRDHIDIIVTKDDEETIASPTILESPMLDSLESETGFVRYFLDSNKDVSHHDSDRSQNHAYNLSRQRDQKTENKLEGRKLRIRLDRSEKSKFEVFFIKLRFICAALFVFYFIFNFYAEIWNIYVNFVISEFEYWLYFKLRFAVTLAKIPLSLCLHLHDYFNRHITLLAADYTSQNVEEDLVQPSKIYTYYQSMLPH